MKKQFSTKSLRRSIETLSISVTVTCTQPNTGRLVTSVEVGREDSWEMRLLDYPVIATFCCNMTFDCWKDMLLAGSSLTSLDAVYSQPRKLSMQEILSVPMEDVTPLCDRSLAFS
jgi:hypothetical protein